MYQYMLRASRPGRRSELSSRLSTLGSSVDVCTLRPNRARRTSNRTYMQYIASCGPTLHAEQALLEGGAPAFTLWAER